MKRKRLLSLLVLLAAVVTGAWAEGKVRISVSNVYGNETDKLGSGCLVYFLTTDMASTDSWAKQPSFEAFKNALEGKYSKGLTTNGALGNTVVNNSDLGLTDEASVTCYLLILNSSEITEGVSYYITQTTNITTSAVSMVSASFGTQATNSQNPANWHEVPAAPAGYTVSMPQDTPDAEKWTARAGTDGTYQQLPLEGVAAGTAVSVKYNGTKKVKSVKAKKKAAAVGNAYLKWDDGQKELVATEIPAEVTMAENADADVHWAAGTYVVEGNVTIKGGIILNGNVELIIKDGATLTANQITGGSSKYNLSIYGQANQTGQLVVNCSNGGAIVNITTLEVHSCQVKATSSFNYWGGFNYISTFNVYGGSVDGEGTGTNGYGIWLNSNGSMNIYGGDVKAVGKGTNNASYGIMGAYPTVTVYGGKLWAENADKAALHPTVTLTKGAGFSGKIEYSSDNSTWSETVDANAKYVRAGY